MFSGQRHALTIVCRCRSLRAQPALDEWASQFGAGAKETETGRPTESAVRFTVDTQSHAKRAGRVLATHWTPLLARATALDLSCVAVVSQHSIPASRILSWARCGLPGEVLWTQETFRALAADTIGESIYQDTLVIDEETSRTTLIATKLALADFALPNQGEPLIGRRLERQRTRTVIQQIAAGNAADQHQLILGNAGIGKSTLLADAARVASRHGVSILRIFCVDYAQLRRQEPVGQLVMGLLGNLDGQGLPQPPRDALLDLCTRLDQQSSAALLLDAADLPIDEEERRVLSRFTPTQLRASRSQLIGRCVQYLAVQNPLMLVVEDLHWGTDDVFDLLAAIVEHAAGHPLVVIATSRPRNGLLDAFPALEAALTRVQLGPMSSKDARTLATRATQGRRNPWQLQSADFLDDARIEQCLIRAGGNPLYLTQLLRMGGVQQTPGGNAETLDALLLKRTERLARGERAFLEVAACIGLYFDIERPLALSSATDADIFALKAAGLVRQNGAEFQFAHALLRDAALASLPEDRRHEIQGALAAAESDPLIRAERWADIGDPRAFSTFVEIGDARRAAYQWFPALAALERAAEVATSPEQRIRALAARGELFEEQGEGVLSVRCFEEAKTLLETLPPQAASALWIDIHLGLLAAFRLLGRLEEAEAAIDLVRRKLDGRRQRSDSPLASARLDYLRGAIAFSQGQLALCQRSHASALRTLEQARPPHTEHRLYAQALSGMGDALYAQGAFLEAREVMERCVSLARRQGLGRIEVGTLHMLGIVSSYVGDPKTGEELARTSWEQACQVGDGRAMLFSELNITLTLFWDGRSHTAEEACQGCIERAQWLGSSVLMGMTRAFIGHVAFDAGDMIKARRHADLALDHLRQGGERLYGAVTLGLALALAAHSPETVSQDTSIDLFERGIALLGTSVISHNYLYFSLGAVPFAMSRGDVDGLWRLLGVLRDFFGREIEECPDGVVVAIIDWVSVHIDILEGNFDSLHSKRMDQVHRWNVLSRRGNWMRGSA